MAFIIVGLGNPGKEYEGTRHNAGRMVVELLGKKEGFPSFAPRKAGGVPALVSEGTIDRKKVTLVLPETYMNNSGKSVKTFVKSTKAAERLLVVRDDVDLPLGTLKMTFGRGSGGHKGVESVMRSVATKDFVQLKIGIAKAGKRHQAKKPGDVPDFVVSKFKPDELPSLKKVLKKGADAVSFFVSEGLEEATTFANTR